MCARKGESTAKLWPRILMYPQVAFGCLCAFKLREVVKDVKTEGG